MFGKNDLSQFVIPAISLVALVTDLIWGRIFNWLTLPILLVGVIAAFFLGGWSTGADSLLGVIAGLALYGWIFWVGAMGGGDVKLLMALGAWGGLHYVIEVAVLGVLLGGVMALGALAVSGRLIGFARRMYRFLLTVFIKELAVESPKIDRKHTIPFGVPIAIAAVWVFFGHPLEKWGIRLWP